MILLKEIDEHNKSYENIKHIDENCIETSCENSDISVFEHFSDVNKTLKMPKGAKKQL